MRRQSTPLACASAEPSSPSTAQAATRRDTAARLIDPSPQPLMAEVISRAAAAQQPSALAWVQDAGAGRSGLAGVGVGVAIAAAYRPEDARTDSWPDDADAQAAMEAAHPRRLLAILARAASGAAKAATTILRR